MMNIPLEENYLEVAISSYLEVALKNSCVSANSTEETPLHALLFIQRKISVDLKMNKKFILPVGLVSMLYMVFGSKEGESQVYRSWNDLV